MLKVSVLETGHTRYCSISGSDPLRQSYRLMTGTVVKPQQPCSPPTTRLPSRHPVWLALPGENFSATSNWKEDWMNRGVWNSFLIDDPSARVPGFDLGALRLGLTQSLSHWSWSVCSEPTSMGCPGQSFLSLRRGSNNGTHRRRVPADKVHWRPTGPPHC